MSLKKYFNFDIAIITLLTSTLLLALVSNAIADDEAVQGRRASTTSHYDMYSDIAQKSFRETEHQAVLITDYILDYIEYAKDVNTPVYIKISDFINSEGKRDLSSINEVLSLVPENSNMPLIAANEIANYLTDFYTTQYNVMLDSYNAQLTHLMNESLVTRQGDDIFSLAESIAQTMLDTGEDLEKKQKQHNYWTEHTQSLDKRKEVFPKPPKTPAPAPTAVAHCLSSGMESSENPTLEIIDEVPEPPEPMILSDDYFIKQLLFMSIPQEDGDEITRNLRTSLYTVLDNMLTTEINKYYKDVKELDVEDKSLASIIKTNRVNSGKEKLRKDVMNAFEFSAHMTFLEMRHNALAEAFGKLLEVVDQIKELQGIEKGDVKNDANKMPAV